MKRIGMMLFLGGSLWLFAVTPLHAELWRCVGPEGAEVFVNKTDGFSGCKRYEPRSEFSVVPSKGAADSLPSRDGRLSVKEPRVRLGHDKPTAVSIKHPKGEVSFEVFRMLSTGMSRAEVLSRAGSPQNKFKNKGTQRWIYSTSDHWIVEIVFSGNNVIQVNSSRP